MTKSSPNKTFKKAIVFGLVCMMAVGVGTASAQEYFPEDNGIFTYHEAYQYRDSEGHPLRLLAYLTHWTGWVVREAVVRPYSYFFSNSEFNRSFFGYREPFDYREPACYTSAGIPDCRSVSPFNGISPEPIAQVGDLGDTEVAGASAGIITDGQVYMPDVAFEYDSASLNALGRGRVRQVAQLLSSIPDLNIVVQGHADIRGGDGYNQDLGQRRADVVMAELTELGIDPARLQAESLGETQPVFTEDEDWAWAVNRRVQFGAR